MAASFKTLRTPHIARVAERKAAWRNFALHRALRFVPLGCNMAANAIGRGAAMTRTAEPGDVVSFWLSQNDKVWFTADPGFDAEVTSRFADLVERAKSGALDDWANEPEGALALVILLDQMTRNIYRDSPEMFAADGKALNVAKRAIERGFDQELPKSKRRWLYMPFMHSEDLADQEQSVELFTRSDIAESVPFAVDHADIIRRFGRFPHRNAILGRQTTPEEAAFLAGGGFSGVTPEGPAERQH
jgi:uncharacterized protein (DUF924 family)